MEQKIRNTLNKIAQEYDFDDNIIFSIPYKEKLYKKSLVSKVTDILRGNLVTCAIAILLIIPTSAWAYQSFLADQFYGSFENIKKHISSATMEGYLLLDAKISQAQGELEKEEYLHFKDLLTKITTAKLKYGNGYGNIDYSQIPISEMYSLRDVLYQIQPYFDKLNEQELSVEVLTASEYDHYINTLITYEQIMAQSGMKNPEDTDKIPNNLREKFTEAENYLMYVNDKQLNN
ncbi:DUF3600 domain-containing protein [Metabacillus litoralis]|uniref:DUF3600 domain-containing protein n=1 Tax=Metabacillus litoralis TaxID=152268 RepID=UPI000EF6153A|nr:DUF3600 domain-containing protein [Metabacillus litoralis]